MADEVVDTNEAPVTDAEPTEPTEPTEEVQPEFSYVTAEDLEAALGKQDSSFKSWLGRRDKETLNYIGQVIDQRLTQNKSQPTADEISAQLLENPDAVLRSKFNQFRQEQTTQQTQHINTAMQTVGSMMEADPLYTDKELGNEVVSEIKNLVQSNKINYNVPSGESGKLVLADALTNVMRKRKNVKTNPLSTNTPSNKGGGIKPPATPSAPKVKVPKLDEYTAKMVKKWNYSEEDIARVLGE